MMNLKARKGLSLAEIVVATAVMALMMTSLISYVQSAGTLWQKSHSTISLTNEGNALLDFIEQELWHASLIMYPSINSTDNYIKYIRKVSDYYDPVVSFTKLDFIIEFNDVDGEVSARVNTTPGNPRYDTAVADGWSVAPAGGQYTIVEARHNYVVCRNVEEFTINRVSNRLLDVTVKLSIQQQDQEDPREIEFKRLIVMH
jgi:hypothetical protein